MSVLKIVATDGHDDAGAAADAVRRQYLELLQAFHRGDWADIARQATVAYLAVGRLAALARAAAETPEE